MKTLVLIVIMCCAAFAQTHADPTATVDNSGTSMSSLGFSMPPADHSMKIFTTGNDLIEITDKTGDLMVRVSADGKVEYGKDYKPADGAKAFWEILAKYYFGVCEQRRKEETPTKGKESTLGKGSAAP